jgi:DNA-binding NarL/FixJ family response regulator
VGERVLIADDNAVVRSLMSAALEQAGFELCGEATGADEAIELAERERPDVCLLDIYMPGSGIRAAGEISSRLPDTAVVMLTSSARDRDLLDSLRAGARGYLPKEIGRADLRQILDKVLAGEVVMPKGLVAAAIRGGKNDGTGRTVRLPDGSEVRLAARQLDLLDMLADGRTTEEIAERLLTSADDVQRELTEIFALLHVLDARSAVRLMISTSDA